MPEAISECGIDFNFIDKDDVYKSVRCGLRYDYTWPWVNNSVMTDWANSGDIMLEKNGTIYTNLKSRQHAPVFTMDELRLWEVWFDKWN